MSALNFFGLGLISPSLLGGVALVFVLTGGALVQRQCTVSELHEQVDTLKKQAKADAGRIEKLSAERDDAVRIGADLRTANEQLAGACEAQSKINVQFSDAMQEQARLAKLAEASHAKEIANQKAVSAWLADLINRQPTLKPGECAAAAAVNEVRKVLRGETALEVRQ